VIVKPGGRPRRYCRAPLAWPRKRVIEVSVPSHVLRSRDLIRKLEAVHSAVSRLTPVYSPSSAAWDQQPHIDLVLDLLVVVRELTDWEFVYLPLDPEIELVDDRRLQRLPDNRPLSQGRRIE